MPSPASKTASRGSGKSSGKSSGKAAPKLPTESMDFPARISPIGGFFLAVPTAIVATIVWTITFHALPIYITALLIVIAGCCVKLVKEAIEDLGQVTVEWTTQGVTVNRLIGSFAFSWSEVEKHDPGATFGDSGRREDGRAGVGLFIRNHERGKERVSDTLPDVLIVSRCGADAERVVKLAEKLAHAKRFAGGRDPRRGGIAQPAGRSTKAFRKTATAA